MEPSKSNDDEYAEALRATFCSATADAVTTASMTQSSLPVFTPEDLILRASSANERREGLLALNANGALTNSTLFRGLSDPDAEIRKLVANLLSQRLGSQGLSVIEVMNSVALIEPPAANDPREACGRYKVEVARGFAWMATFYALHKATKIDSSGSVRAAIRLALVAQAQSWRKLGEPTFLQTSDHGLFALEPMISCFCAMREFMRYFDPHRIRSADAESPNRDYAAVAILALVPPDVEIEPLAEWMYSPSLRMVLNVSELSSNDLI